MYSDDGQEHIKCYTLVHDETIIKNNTLSLDGCFYAIRMYKHTKSNSITKMI